MRSLLHAKTHMMQMMAIMRDAHQWALAAAALLEEKMEQLSCSTSQHCSSSHRCSHSHAPVATDAGGPRYSGCQDPQVTSHHGEPGAESGGSQAEVLGDLCWGEGTLINQMKAWNVMPEWMRHTGCPHQCGGLKSYARRPIGWGHGWKLRPYQGGRRPGVSPPLEPHLQTSWVGKSPPQQAPRWKADCHPLPISMPRDPEPSPLHQFQWIEWALQTCLWHCPGGGTGENPQPQGLPAICLKSVGIFWSPQGMQLDAKKVDNDYTYPPIPSINREVSLPTTRGWEVWHVGFLAGPKSITPCTYAWGHYNTGPRKAQLPNHWWASAHGRKCSRALAGNGATGHLYRRWGLHSHDAPSNWAEVTLPLAGGACPNRPTL